MSAQQQIQERTRGWFETTVSAGPYNTFDTKVNHQQGGAIIIVRYQLAHRNCARVYDSLERWIVMTFRGRARMSLHIAPAYRPQANAGPYSVYQQQL